jgi:hypothetical protein
MRDLARVALSPLVEVMAALYHISNLWGSLLSWYLGNGAARYCGGQGVSCR